MKLWGGRFTKEENALVHNFNASISFDQKFYKQDIRGSIAHVTMLASSGILTDEEKDVIVAGLNGILNDIESGALEIDQTAEDILHQVARNIHESNLMKRYVNNLAKSDREKWQLSEVDKAMANGAEKACEIIRDKAEGHLIGLTSRMEWFPIAYHLADKVALVVFPVLAYYTGKYHLNDTMTFLWAMAFMPIFVLSAIWAINELAAYLERRKKKPKSRR